MWAATAVLQRRASTAQARTKVVQKKLVAKNGIVQPTKRIVQDTVALVTGPARAWAAQLPYVLRAIDADAWLGRIQHALTRPQRRCDRR